MLCHDVNIFTKSPNHLDVIIGSSSADILWYEPLSQKYARINKNVRATTMAVNMLIVDICRGLSTRRLYPIFAGSPGPKTFSWLPTWMDL